MTDEPPSMLQMPGTVATGIVASLKSQPALMAIVLMNVVMVLGLIWAASNLAQARADFVALGGELMVVPQAMVQARSTLRVVRQNLAWAAAYNLACIPLAVAGWLPAWLAGLGMAASSLLVVLNAARLAGGGRQVAR